jgi:Meiotically Up-regulated Gene 113 (MUG113) protein
VSKTTGFVYLFVWQSTGWYKIGCSEKNPENRLNWIREGAPWMDIDLVDYVCTNDFKRLENAFHTVFRAAKVSLEEWSQVSTAINDLSGVGRSEWFKLDVHQVELFRALAQTTGGAEEISLMSKEVQRLEILLNACERHRKKDMERYDARVDRLEDLKYEYQAANEKNAHLQAENNQLRAALVEAGLEIEGEG